MLTDNLYNIIFEGLRVFLLIGGATVAAIFCSALLFVALQSFFLVNDHMLSYAGRALGLFLLLLLAFPFMQRLLVNFYMMAFAIGGG